jgi:hypothetical protein
MDKIYKG